VDFTNIVGIEGGIGPAEVLDALVRDHAQLARISRRLQQPGDYEAMFFGACVAFRCAQWHAARQHIYRALSFLPAGVESGNLRQEMRHLLAVAIRFSMCKAAEFSEANTILEEEADYFSNRSDPLGHARALSERATLHGWAIQKAAMLPRSSIPSVRPIFSHDFSLIARQLKLAAEDPRCKKGGAWYGAWSIVNLQFAANLIGSEILRQYFVPKVPAVSSDLLDTAVATVEKQLRGGAFPKVLGLGVRMLRWGAMTDHKVRAAEGEAIRQECERITADPTAGELADLDRAELEEFARIVGGSPSAKAS
jgi:hypothetical protein